MTMHTSIGLIFLGSANAIQVGSVLRGADIGALKHIAEHGGFKETAAHGGAFIKSVVEDINLDELAADPEWCGTGPWAGNPDVDAWCNANCNYDPDEGEPNCPADLCELCDRDPTVEPTASPTVYVAPTPAPPTATPAPPTVAPTEGATPTTAPTPPTTIPSSSPTPYPTSIEYPSSFGGSPPIDPSLCENTCEFVFDGDCDDGGPGADYASCDYGTDCTDCCNKLGDSRPECDGTPTPPPTTEGCSNTCEYAFDVDCDDGGPGSDYDTCDYGTDCFDCCNKNGDSRPECVAQLSTVDDAVRAEKIHLTMEKHQNKLSSSQRKDIKKQALQAKFDLLKAQPVPGYRPKTLKEQPVLENTGEKLQFPGSSCPNDDLGRWCQAECLNQSNNQLVCCDVWLSKFGECYCSRNGGVNDSDCRKIPTQ